MLYYYYLCHSGIVVNALAFGPRSPGSHLSHAIILLVSNLGHVV